MKGMILAAGKGTRVMPITQVIPKPMIPILGKPVMESMIQLLASHGVDQIAVNTCHLAEVIEDYFGNGHHFDVQLSYSYEGEMQDGKFVARALGSAGGMKKIQEFSGFFDETFVVVCGDAWIDLDFTEAVRRHKESGGIATIITKNVPICDVSKYGVVVTDVNNKVISFQEKPSIKEALSTQVNSGIYIFEPEIFNFIPPDVEFDIGSQLFPLLVEKQMPLYAATMDFQWLDVGNISDIWGVTSDILEGKVEGYPIPGTEIQPGVWVGINTVFDIENCNITPPVIIGSGCEIQNGATIAGPALIGANCRIESQSVISRSIICDYIQITGTACIENKTVFGDYFIGHDGAIRSLTGMNNVSIIKGRCITHSPLSTRGEPTLYTLQTSTENKDCIISK